MAIALAIAIAAPAEAGQFSISACHGDPLRGSSAAFEDFSTRGMAPRRACDPEGPGLISANVVRSGRVARGARSVFVLTAPPGTVFSQYRWSGNGRRRDCRYAMQLYAERPGASPVSILNQGANRRCPRPGKAQYLYPTADSLEAAIKRPKAYDVSGATRIVQRVVCVGDKRRFCSSRGLNYVRTFTAQATVIDNSGPTVSIIQDNPFTRGEWSRGTQSVTYDASDNAGVRTARAVLAGAGKLTADDRPCDFAQRVPCPNGPGHISVDTRSLPEGSQPLGVVAEDAGGNPGPAPPGSIVRIDNTAPGAVAVASDRGDAWTNQNAFDLSWINAPEGDRAPISSADFKVCRAGTEDCSAESRAGAGISHVNDLAVPGPGEWTVRLWRGDAAGNIQPANASVPVSLRFDPEPPTLGFEDRSPTDPTRLSALVTDRVSGLASGDIEISQEGTNTWHTLDTQQEASRLVAHVDDARLAPGRYVVRASARDQAGNQSTTDRLLDGEPMTVNLPLRATAVLESGEQHTRRVRRAVGRRGHRRVVSKRVHVLRPRTTVRYGERVHLGGRLKIGIGQGQQALPGATVAVWASTPTEASPQLVASLTTDGEGRFSYSAPATTSRTVYFVYDGTATVLPVRDEVVVRARGRSTFGVSKRRTLNGRPVTFRGQVQGRPLPANGKLVELQVRLSKAWQTFATPRADASGGWRVRYRFRRTCGVQRFRFRAHLPPEAGYPLEEGTSRSLSVRVKGPPCP